MTPPPECLARIGLLLGSDWTVARGGQEASIRSGGRDGLGHIRDAVAHQQASRLQGHGGGLCGVGAADGG